MASVDVETIETSDGQKHDEREGLFGRDASPEWASFRQSAHAALRPIASLKLTVVLFALSIFIVLAGTFAQVNLDIWAVVNEYFRINFARVGSSDVSLLEKLSEFFVWVDFQIFLPPAFTTGPPPDLPAWMGVWFPKGWTIGAVMMLNLFAAHLVRFRIQTSGPRLVLGLATLGLGCLVTALVVMSGHDSDGVQSDAVISYAALWKVLQFSLIGTAALALIFLVNSPAQQKALRWLLGGSAVLLGLAQVATMFLGQIDDSSMRILYQLLKGLLAGGVLLAGCILVFRKRAGIVLLHGGIGLIMVYDVLVGTAHVESRMLIEEGQTVSYSEDIRTVELAVIDRSDEDQDWHTVVPASLLQSGAKLSDDDLPFDVEVVEFFPNSDLRRITDELKAEEDYNNPATDGVGLRFVAVGMRATAGTDTGGNVDLPSVYVTLTDRDSGETLGTWLLSVLMEPPFFRGPAQTVEGTPYELALRFKRMYNPYQVTLLDVQKNDYIGTDNPRDYRSQIRITDPEREASFEYPVWMNNPLRYGGATFYQSSYYGADKLYEGAPEATGLQVVSNTGWMIPYVSCMIVMVGMLAQFVLTLSRFLNRRFAAYQQISRVESPDSPGTPPGAKTNGKELPSVVGKPLTPLSDTSRRGWLVPVVAASLTALLIAYVARPRSTPSTEMQINQFAKLPVLYQGRPQPFDSLATNALLLISDKQTFKHDTTDEDEKSRPAIVWLLDVIARQELAEQHQVFRIESIDIQKRLGLERREGNRYALAEFREGYEEALPEIQAAQTASQAKEQLTLVQRKLLDLHQKISTYSKMQTAFADMGRLVPELPTTEEVQNNQQVAMQKVMQLRAFMADVEQKIAEFKFPLSVPTHLDRDEKSFSALKETDWLSYPAASIYAEVDRQMSQLVAESTISPPASYVMLTRIFAAWQSQDTGMFNGAVGDYRRLLASVSPQELAPPEADTSVQLKKTDFEAYFNTVGPFNFASWLYVASFLLVAFSWLGWTRPLNRAAFWVIVITFLLHTAALIGRIYISGRPPVTNLYSSAVFIGWGAVLFGIILEAVYGRGTGNVLAALVGFQTLRIAHGLSMDGDTFAVLEAVLDTQFWLATHVVCVTMGYAATFVCGGLGALYVLRGVFTKTLDSEMERTLTRMNYGVLCFALFFSFVGTVLGGLWADDSWGRFWGWDPKENGALIIVLWNVLILHARWDGMIKGRGLAVLTVLGSIVVSWSWFGTNELGVGLHSYGFTEGRLQMLGIFCLSALAVAAIGCLPRSLWRSTPRSEGRIEI
jgi:ABC-type transport system involved in cytochrome c biogenesis permease subunit